MSAKELVDRIPCDDVSRPAGGRQRVQSLGGYPKAPPPVEPASEGLGVTPTNRLCRSTADLHTAIVELLRLKAFRDLTYFHPARASLASPEWGPDL